MKPGLQEALALVIVVAVVAFAVYRRLRRGSGKRARCSSNNGGQAEHTIHFYKRDSR